jgi:hypothetical protein
MKQQIKGLTLIRPWAAAVSHFGKDVENRSWKCPLPRGSFLAIHSGSKWDEGGVDFIRRYCADEYALQVYGSLLCHELEHFKGAIVAVAEFGGNIESSDSVWWNDREIGWKLSNIVPIDPVWCKGQQGLWDLAPDTLIQVRAAYSKSLKIHSKT